MRILLLCSFSACSAFAFQTGAAFKAGCTTVPPVLNVVNPIDKGTGACGIAGKTGATDTEILQNKAKNNLCATGKPVDVTMKLLVDLQGLVAPRGITFGNDEKLPKSRKALADPPFDVDGKKVGEGMLVRLEAFIKEAHHADTSSGESVNCKRLGDANNDIHIALVASPGDQECTSVTAEAIPHFRPASWTRLGDIQKEASVAKKTNGKQFRFTGQLLFDAAHQPCTSSCQCGSGQ